MLVSKLEFIHKKNLYFRVDAGSNIGLGHLMRSSALASILSKYYNCILLTYNLPILLNNSLIGFHEIKHLESFDPISINNYIPINSIIILDGYDFDEKFQIVLKKNGHFIVSIDDIHQTHFVSDIIINHGVNIKVEDYDCEDYTKIYAGLNYIMLRDPFYDLMSQNRRIYEIKNLLVIPGGNDIREISIMLLQNKESFDFKNIHIISGAGSNSFEKLELISKNFSNVIIHQNLNANQLINVANQCEICICTPSGISYEMSCIGIGLVLCKIADNQQHFYDFFVKNQLALGCDFNSDNILAELIKLVNKLKFDIELVNMQIKNQKKYFRSLAKNNIIKIFQDIK